jgi:aspartyl/asparaginyl-tRNA synthetase
MSNAAASALAVSEQIEPRTARIENLSSFLGLQVSLNGWLVETRRTRQVRFITVRDRTGTVQSICRDPSLFERIDSITPESAICIAGRVQLAKAKQFGAIEIDTHSIRILSLAAAPSAQRAITRIPYRFLQLRSQKQALLFSVRTTVLRELREFLLSEDFLELHTPKITLGGSESGAALFEILYFNRKACLAQSPQFYMQMAMAAGLERIFEIGPVFRAEPSTTGRHATEFTCFDVEMSWVTSHHELMDLEERLLGHVLYKVQQQHGAEIKRHFGLDVEIPRRIHRMTFEEALKIRRPVPTEGPRLTFQMEQDISKWVLEHYGSSFVFITNYPSSMRPFYSMEEAPSDGTLQSEATSRSFDLLWRGLEVTSGCQREHEYERVRSQALAKGIERETIEHYLDPHYMPMFRHGCPPHGGFGIGIERLLMALLGCHSIEEASFIYRGPEHLVP